MKRKRHNDIDISDTGRIILDDDNDRRQVKKKKKKTEEVVELSVEEKREKVRTKGKFEIEKTRKKKSVGDDIRKGKTAKVERKLDRLERKTLAVMQQIQNDDTIVNLPMAQGKLAGEQDFFDEFNTIFSTTRSLLRRLEGNMLDPEKNISSKDVYALCTMYSNMRETINDMRSIKDMHAQAQEIESIVFAPLAKTVAGILIDMYHRFNRDLINNVKNPDQLATLQALFKDMISETSSKMKSEFDNSASRVITVLHGG
jgi:hypothetical protein